MKSHESAFKKHKHNENGVKAVSKGGNSRGGLCKYEGMTQQNLIKDEEFPFRSFTANFIRLLYGRFTV